MDSLKIAYSLLLLSFCLIAYDGVGFLLKKWDEYQKRKAEESTTQFEEMFIFLRKEVIIFLYILIPLALGSLGFILSKKIWLAFILMVAGALFPLWLVRTMDKKRRAKFNSQLADGLMIMSSCLKGGLTLMQSFEILAEEMAPPIAQEASLLIREVKVGVPIEEALVRMDKRMPSEELTLIVSAILVARETGGDLTKVFSRLVETIRDRMKLKEMITTLTLQARLQAFIISLLGPVFVVVILRTNPHHFDVMWQNDLGRVFLIIAGFLQLLGIVLIVIFGKIKI